MSQHTQNAAAPEEKQSGFVLTGRHVIFTTLGIFTVVGGVNAFMVTKAVTTFRGEDIKKSFRQGLAYNETLNRRAQQRASGWTANLTTMDDNTIQLAIIDSGEIPVRGLTITGLVKHPTDTGFDIALAFTPLENGSYSAHIETEKRGKRWLVTKAIGDGGFVFETRNEIWLK